MTCLCTVIYSPTLVSFHIILVSAFSFLVLCLFSFITTVTYSSMSLPEADLLLPDSVREGIDEFLAAPDAVIALPSSGDSDPWNRAQIPVVAQRPITDLDLAVDDSLPLLPTNHPPSGYHSRAAITHANLQWAPVPPIGSTLRVWYGPDWQAEYYHEEHDPFHSDSDDLPVLVDALDINDTDSDDDIPDLVDIGDDIGRVFFVPVANLDIGNGATGA